MFIFTELAHFTNTDGDGRKFIFLNYNYKIEANTIITLHYITTALLQEQIPIKLCLLLPYIYGESHLPLLWDQSKESGWKVETDEKQKSRKERQEQTNAGKQPDMRTKAITERLWMTSIVHFTSIHFS